jgi:hypothetical protein
MRIIAILANIALLLTVFIDLASRGLPGGARDVWIVSLVIVAPILSLIAIFSMKNSESWLALFLKRKALEEQKRIDELGKHADG